MDILPDPKLPDFVVAEDVSLSVSPSISHSSRIHGPPPAMSHLIRMGTVLFRAVGVVIISKGPWFAVTAQVSDSRLRTMTSEA